MFYNNGYNQDWSTLKKLIWLRGNPATGQIGTDLTVSGTPPLSLPNSLGKPLKAWEVDVLPYQEGTGDPAPDNVRPIYGTDKLTITTAGKNLLSYPYAWNTSTANDCTATVAQDGSVTFSGTPSGSAIFNIKRRTDTTGDASLFMQAGEYIFNGCPANGSATTYRANIINSSGQVMVSDNGNGATFTIPTGGMFIGVQLFVNSGYDPSALTFYPMIRLSSVSDDAFTPYLAPSQTVITLPQTVYTGTIGSDGGESRWGEVDLGTLTWTQEYSGEAYQQYAVYSGAPTNLKFLGQLICLCFLGVQKQTNIMGINEISITNSQAYCIPRVKTSANAYASAAAFKAAMSGVQLVYELTTPVQFPLTAPTIPTPTGTATTWATAEDGTVESMEVTYVGKA